MREVEMRETPLGAADLGTAEVEVVSHGGRVARKRPGRSFVVPRASEAVRSSFSRSLSLSSS